MSTSKDQSQSKPYYYSSRLFKCFLCSFPCVHSTCIWSHNVRYIKINHLSYLQREYNLNKILRIVSNLNDENRWTTHTFPGYYSSFDFMEGYDLGIPRDSTCIQAWFCRSVTNTVKPRSNCNTPIHIPSSAVTWQNVLQGMPTTPIKIHFISSDARCYAHL